MSPGASTVILDVHLNHRLNEILDVSPNATDGRFRLMSCEPFIQHTILCVEEFEFSDIGNIRYATVSYPWRGVVANNPRDIAAPTFQVHGSSHCGDPINPIVLRDACIAARYNGADYIWFDRISVLQAEDRSADKYVQIGRMHEVYSCCMLCIVIPGGLRRFVSLDEETTWIQRGWTLQEAIAPPKVIVLFAWKLGSGNIRAGDIEDSTFGTVIEITPGETATLDLVPLVVTSSEGFLTFFRGNDNDREEPTCHIATKIFGSSSPYARALSTAMAQDGHQDMRDQAIWTCAQLRTASRSVDMVLSIMGLFGVTLQAERYGPDDRLRATVDLAKQILDQGRTASWLGISFQLPPSKYLSTFSIFPQTCATGGAHVQTRRGPRSVSEFIGGECLSPETHTWYLSMGYRYEDAGIRPHTSYGSMMLERHDEEIQRRLGRQSTQFQTGGLRGSIDDEGYLSLKALAIRVRQCRRDEGETIFHSVDGKTWKPCTDASARDNEGIYWAVFVGVYKRYHALVYQNFRPGDGDFAKIMVVAERDSRLHKSHAVTFCTTTSPLHTSGVWSLREFKIGGLFSLPQGRAEAEIMNYDPQVSDGQQADTHEIYRLRAQINACSQKEVEDFFRKFPEATTFDLDAGKTSHLGRFKADVREQMLSNFLSQFLK
ncbi:hypothetical protein JVU11DRAFT_7724 [Chiua virens]|nr:hypothetical protein JVU11DRAFT_7724 [Chiua virens]